MILNIRGCSGSGKSTVIRSIMERGVVTPLGALEGGKSPAMYRVEIHQLMKPLNGSPLYVIGPYLTACGGCDAIATQDEACKIVSAIATQGHVLFEGLLLSTLFSRYAELDKALSAATGQRYVWAFLDTPLDVCLARCDARREERRLAKRNPPPYKAMDPKNTTDKWKLMRVIFEKCKRAGLDARWLDHTKAPEEVMSWLAS